MSRSLLTVAITVSLALTGSAVAGIGCGGGTRTVNSGKIAKPKLPPVNPEALRDFDSAMRAIRLGGPDATDKALTRLESAVRTDAKLWEAWHNLGALHARNGNARKAVSAFNKAIAINPAHVASRIGRADSHRTLGNVSKARKDYKTVLSALAEEDDDAARKSYRATGSRLASLLRSAKRYEDAIDVIREIFRVAGSDAKVYVELGLIYLSQKRLALASLVLNKAASADVKEPSIYNAQALIALEKGDAQKAFDLFDRATSMDPRYVDARFNKASVLLDAGDYQRALEDLLVITNAAPDNMPALLALGIAYRGIKDFPHAKETWDRVVKRTASGSRISADALFNLAILAGFQSDDKATIRALDRYLQASPANHPKRKEAGQRKKELGS